MADQEPTVLQRQGLENTPVPSSYGRGTNLIFPPQKTTDLIRNFSEEVYNLRAESHLTRLLKVVLGDAGAGQVRKRYFLQRLQGSISGSSWIDLDRFYGAFFHISRNPEEILLLNPYTDLGTSEEWRDEIAKDASFKSRVSQLTRAITWGTSAIGMELAAEAVLGGDVDIFEAWQEADIGAQTYGQIEVNIGTYGGMENFTYSELSGENNLTLSSQNRCSFSVLPKQAITEFDRFNLVRVLNRLKPVNSFMQIIPEIVTLHVPVNPIAIFADSEWWEINTGVNTRVFGTNSPYLQSEGEQPGPVWTEHQGEAWSYNVDVESVTTYAIRTSGTLPPVIDETIAFLDGTSQTYSGYKAITPWQAIQAGRVVSDGVLTSSFYNATRNTNSSLDVAPLYVDHIPIDSLVTTIANQSTNRPYNSDSYFWSTTPRLNSDTTQETLEIVINDTKRINYLAFEVPDFPHTLVAEYSMGGNWTTIFTNTVRTSLPRIIPGLTASAHLHPQHSVSGHWLKVGGELGEILTNRIRFRLQRVATSSPPVNLSGRPVPFSLGLRNVEVGFRISSIDDVPRVNGTFAVSSDILGSSLSYSMRQEGAVGLLADLPTPWRCDPQPIGNAVVNLYLDMRNQLGEGQVFDRLYVDPIYPGPSMHIYYSNDVPTGSFDSTDAPLIAPTATVVGSIVYNDDGASLSDTNTSGFVLNNEVISLNKTQPWWFGIDFIPSQNSNSMVGNILCAMDSLSDGSFNPESDNTVSLFSNAITFSNGVTLLSLPSDYQAGDPIRVVIASLPEPSGDLPAATHMWVQIGARPLQHTSHITAPYVITALSKILIGQDPATSVDPSPFTLRNYVLKQETPTIDAIQGFIADPQAYTLKPTNRKSIDYTKNALVRFNLAYYFPDIFTTGFVGGPGTNIYETLEWAPIERDYSLQKGFCYFNPIHAKYLKLEFSNLVPRPYESMTNLSKTVKLFPSSVMLNFQRSLSTGVVNVPGGFATNQTLSKTSQYKDAWKLLTGLNFAPSLTNPPPTEGVYAIDPSQREDIRSQSTSLGLTQWVPNTIGPAFSQKSVHLYTEVEIEQQEKICYLVGLQRVQPYRIDYTTEDNTLAYLENFYTIDNIASGVE